MINHQKLLQLVRDMFKEKLNLVPVRGAHQMYHVTPRDGRTYLVRVRDSSEEETRKFGQIPHHLWILEFATVDFVRNYTKIPVTRMSLYRGSDDGGGVGAEWMIEEAAPGIPLSEAWPEMSREQRKRASISVGEVWAALLKCRFKHIGCLYPTMNSNPTDQHVLSRVGPLNFKPDCDECRMQSVLQRGPFSSARDWLLALAKRELDFTYAKEWTYEESTQIAAVVAKISSSQALQVHDEVTNAASRFVLEHVDLQPHNIRVDPSNPAKIIAVLGWQGARIIPRFAVEPGFPKDLECSDPEERNMLSRTMLDTIALRVPEWNCMKTEAGRELRSLYLLAKESYRFRDLGYALD